MNEGGTGCNHELEVIRQKLQCVASKLQHLAQKASNRLDFFFLLTLRDGILLHKLGKTCPSVIASQRGNVH